jgi:hypothetical protein
METAERAGMLDTCQMPSSRQNTIDDSMSSTLTT